MKRRDLGVAAIAAVGAAAAGAGYWAYRNGAQAVPDNPLWAAQFETPTGTPLLMSSFHGKPLILNFWATWCAPCVKEMPQLDRFHREFAAKGWQVVGLAIDNPAAVRTFLAKLPVAFPIGMAGMEGADLGRALGNVQGGLPFTAVFDSSGRQIERKSGETSYDELLGWSRQFA